MKYLGQCELICGLTASPVCQFHNLDGSIADILDKRNRASSFDTLLHLVGAHFMPRLLF